MNTLHVKTGDTVKVISGRSKGGKGKVVAVSPKEGKVIVEGVNMVSKHVKPKRQGESGGICLLYTSQSSSGLKTSARSWL